MENSQHPELHVNEEPRNDLIDTGVGFLGFFGAALVVGILFTIIEIAIR